MSAAPHLPYPVAAPTPPTARVVSINRITEVEYFALDEATTDRRLEYYDGEIVAMAGAQPVHNDIVLNLGAGLRSRLKNGNCRVRVADQRVHIPAKRGYVYPDVVAACGPWQYQPNTRPAALLNPVLIIEVLSPTTAAHDLTRKFAYYQTIPSLRHYVLLDSEHVGALLYSREPGAALWTLHLYDELTATLPLPALSVELPLAEAYHAVVFGEGE